MTRWIVPLFLLLLLLSGCAEKKSPTDTDERSHPDTWVQTESAEFHGWALTTGERDFESCTACHGADLSGSNIAQGCYEQDCHIGPMGHTENWMNLNSEAFHARGVGFTGIERCALCHATETLDGWDYDGGQSDVSCDGCHGGPSGHPIGWLSPTSGSNFHGLHVELDGPQRCQECHGLDYRGGVSEVSCYGACHDGPGGHPAGWMNDESEFFHEDEVENNGSSDCQRCHGDNLLGGTSDVGCNDCHGWPPPD